MKKIVMYGWMLWHFLQNFDGKKAKIYLDNGYITIRSAAPMQLPNIIRRYYMGLEGNLVQAEGYNIDVLIGQVTDEDYEKINDWETGMKYRLELIPTPYGDAAIWYNQYFGNPGTGIMEDVEKAKSGERALDAFKEYMKSNLYNDKARISFPQFFYDDEKAGNVVPSLEEASRYERKVAMMGYIEDNVNEKNLFDFISKDVLDKFMKSGEEKEFAASLRDAFRQIRRNCDYICKDRYEEDEDE